YFKPKNFWVSSYIFRNGFSVFMKILKRLFVIIVIIFLLIFAVSLFAPKAKQIEYGFSFSAPYAESLGLNWKQTYLASLEELKPKYVRLSAYWDTAESEQNIYKFEDLDF